MATMANHCHYGNHALQGQQGLVPFGTILPVMARMAIMAVMVDDAHSHGYEHGEGHGVT